MNLESSRKVRLLFRFNSIPIDIEPAITRYPISDSNNTLKSWNKDFHSLIYSVLETTFSNRLTCLAIIPIWSCAARRLAFRWDGFATSATASVLSAIPTYDQQRSREFVMNAPSATTRTSV